MGCICNNLVWRSLVNVPPDLSPTDELFYMNELYIDTTGYAIGNSIVSISVDGVKYNAGVYGAGTIGGLSVNSVDWVTSINVALIENGVDINSFYVYGFGGGASVVSFGVASTSTHTIVIEWADGNGNEFITTLVERTSTTSLCSTHTGDMINDIITDYRFVFPQFLGGPSPVSFSSGLFSTVEFVMNDMYGIPNSLITYSGTFYPDLIVVQNGPDYTITGTNFFLPLSDITTTGGSPNFSNC